MVVSGPARAALGEGIELLRAGARRAPSRATILPYGPEGLTPRSAEAERPNPPAGNGGRGAVPTFQSAGPRSSRVCLWHPSEDDWEEHGRVRVSDSTTRRVRDSTTNDAEDGNRPPWVGNSVVAIELITGNSPGLDGIVAETALPKGRAGASEPTQATLHGQYPFCCLRAGRNAAQFSAAPSDGEPSIGDKAGWNSAAAAHPSLSPHRLRAGWNAVDCLGVCTGTRKGCTCLLYTSPSPRD